MFIVRNKEGELIAIASREEDAIAMAASTSIDRTDYIVEESTDGNELREVYRSYYKTR